MNLKYSDDHLTFYLAAAAAAAFTRWTDYLWLPLDVPAIHTGTF